MHLHDQSIKIVTTTPLNQLIQPRHLLSFLLGLTDERGVRGKHDTLRVLPGEVLVRQFAKEEAILVRVGFETQIRQIALGILEIIEIERQ